MRTLGLKKPKIKKVLRIQEDFKSLKCQFFWAEIFSTKKENYI